MVASMLQGSGMAQLAQLSPGKQASMEPLASFQDSLSVH
jgi:hypothetical protein